MKKRVSAALLSLFLTMGMIITPAKALNPTETYGDFQYRNDGDHITILGYTSTEPDIVFPDYIDGLPVTVIAGMTFDPGHPDTRSIYLPQTVSNIDLQLANLCLRNLENIYVSEKNTTYKDIDGVLFSKDGKILLLHPTAHSVSYAIPGGTEQIHGDSFYGANLEELHIPDTVTYIGWGAFAACTKLKHLELPASVKIVKDSAFGNCNQLKWVYIAGDTTLCAFAFSKCSSLQKFIAPGEVTVGYECFESVPETCDFYMSSHMNIYDASGVAVSVDREDPEDLEALAAFQAPRSVNLFAGIRYSLLNQGLDDQQLSNIHTVSFDENKKPSAAFSLFFPVSHEPAKKPTVYHMDENGMLTETEIYWAGGWAIVSTAREGIYLTLQQGAAMGDLDGDGSINIADVMELCKVLARQAVDEMVSEANVLRGDLNGDENITIDDVMEICKVMARHI